MKNKSMSRIVVGSIAVVCLILALGASAQAQPGAGKRGRESCSDRTLFGDYGGLIEGTILGPNLALRTLIMAHFDGEGSLTEVDHVVLNGVPPAAEEEWRPATGTYSVNPDCTGSAVFNTGNPPISVHFVVVNHGKDLRGVVDGAAITISISRVD
jgi:hypothetical protein